MGTGSRLEMLDQSPTHKPNGAPCHMGWHAMEAISESEIHLRRVNYINKNVRAVYHSSYLTQSEKNYTFIK